MKNEPNGHFRVSVHKQGDTAVSRLFDRRLLQTPAAPACALGLLLISFCGVAGAQGNSPTQLRQFIDQQVGGINKLKVPATDAEIPVPRMPDGTVNPRYQTTEAKRFLGKMLFHDPIRTARINITERPARRDGLRRNCERIRTEHSGDRQCSATGHFVRQLPSRRGGG